MESGTTGRQVYLPKGQWIDYQTGKLYSGGWQKIEAGQIPVVLLVREGAIVPQMKPAQSTSQLDWKNLEMVVYAAGAQAARSIVAINIMDRTRQCFFCILISSFKILVKPGTLISRFYHSFPSG